MCCNCSEPSYPPFAMFACHLLKGMKKAPFSECLSMYFTCTGLVFDLYRTRTHGERSRALETCGTDINILTTYELESLECQWGFHSNHSNIQFGHKKTA